MKYDGTEKFSVSHHDLNCRCSVDENSLKIVGHSIDRKLSRAQNRLDKRQLRALTQFILKEERSSIKENSLVNSLVYSSPSTHNICKVRVELLI